MTFIRCLCLFGAVGAETLLGAGFAWGAPIDAPTNGVLSLSAIHGLISGLAGTLVNFVGWSLVVVVAILLFWLCLSWLRYTFSSYRAKHNLIQYRRYRAKLNL